MPSSDTTISIFSGSESAVTRMEILPLAKCSFSRSSIAYTELLTASNTGCSPCVAFEGFGSFRTLFSILFVRRGTAVYPETECDSTMLSDHGIVNGVKQSERQFER